MQPAFSAATARIVEEADAAFLAHGYAQPTMAELAELCGVGRRALYYHFHDKEELFRAVMRHFNAKYQAEADIYGTRALERGDPPAEIIGGWLDTRFGETRRKLLASRFGGELNTVGFRIGSDIMIEVSYETNRKLGDLVATLAGKGHLKLKPGISADVAAQMLADGARGVNQQRPPIPDAELGARYRAIVTAILFGCAVDHDHQG